MIPGDEGMGLSALGWQAVHRLLSGEPEMAVERFFLGKGFVAPLSAESQRELNLFPLIAASVSFEEDFLPLLRALTRRARSGRKAGTPGLSADSGGRTRGLLNPAPRRRWPTPSGLARPRPGLRDFCRALKRAVYDGVPKAEFLASVAHLPGLYVPGLSKAPVRRVVALDPADSTLLSTPVASFHRPAVGLPGRHASGGQPGCPHACRFCAAGFVYVCRATRAWPISRPSSRRATP